jgi:hypothetical protein
MAAGEVKLTDYAMMGILARGGM